MWDNSSSTRGTSDDLIVGCYMETFNEMWDNSYSMGSIKVDLTFPINSKNGIFR